MKRRLYLSVLPRIFAAFVFIYALTAVAAPEWCSRPAGASVREAIWASIQPMLPQMKKLAGKQDFAIISTPTLLSIASNAAAYKEGYMSSYITAFLQKKAGMEQQYIYSPEFTQFIKPHDTKTETEIERIMSETANKHSREFVRGAVGIADEVSRKETLKITQRALAAGNADYTDVDESGEIIGFTYVYASSSHFRKKVGIDAVERGATLLTTGVDLKRVYDDKDGFKEYLKGVKFIFIDNLLPGASSPLEGPERVLIRIPAMENGSYADIIGFAHGDRRTRFIVFSLLPETVDAAKQWNLDEHLTRSYIAAGKTIAKELKRTKIERGIWTSPETLARAIEQAVKNHYNPILVGESAENGRVRLAGLSGSFDPELLSEAARKATYFIFCNSSQGQANRAGFSIEGKIYVNAAAELLGTFAAAQNSENSREGATAANKSLRQFIGALVSETTGSETQVVDVYKFNGRPKPVLTSSPPPFNVVSVDDQTWGNNMSYMLVLYGAFGGICMEFFRWRALLLRPRGRQYLKPTYIILSCIFILLAGGVGLVFGRLAPSDLLQTITAFIAGAGLEELIKRASRLKSPNVPFDQSGVKASLGEFLSG